jgi:hypothetical protein
LLILFLAGLDISSLPVELTECERKSLHARTQKLDLELAIDDRLLLPDQLVQPLLGHDALAVGVDVSSMSPARRLPIDQRAELHGRRGRRRTMLPAVC